MSRLGIFLAWLLVSVSPSLSAAPNTLFVVAGQSNATGLASPVELQQDVLRAPQDSVLFYRNSTVWTPGSVTGAVAWALQNPPSWGPLQLPTEPETPPRGKPTDVKGIFGPEFFLGRTYASDQNEKIAVIKSDWPGTNLAVQWNPQATKGPRYYDKMLKNTRQGITDLKTKGIEGPVTAFFWMQGEGDTPPPFAGSYQKNLAHLIERVRQDFSNPDLPFVFGQISSQSKPGGGKGGEIVRAAQKAVADSVAHTAMVVTNDLPLRPTDPKIDPFPIHFNTAGQLALGERFAWAFETLEGRSAPEPIPGLINTGVIKAITADTTNQVSNRLDDDAEDPGWTARTDAGPESVCLVAMLPVDSSWINHLASQGPAVTAYPNSKWITPSPAISLRAGPVTYQMHFNLSGFNPASAVITGQFAAAEGTQVFLNGGDLHLHPIYAYDNWTPFSIQANTLPQNVHFVEGDNKLTFVAPAATESQGLRVEFIDAVARR